MLPLLYISIIIWVTLPMPKSVKTTIISITKSYGLLLYSRVSKFTFINNVYSKSFFFRYYVKHIHLSLMLILSISVHLSLDHCFFAWSLFLISFYNVLYSVLHFHTLLLSPFDHFENVIWHPLALFFSSSLRVASFAYFSEVFLNVSLLCLSVRFHFVIGL